MRLSYWYMRPIIDALASRICAFWCFWRPVGLGYAEHGRRGGLCWMEMVSIGQLLFKIRIEGNTNPTPRLYIVEGCITVVFAGICVLVVPKNYETAYFLNDEDKALMRVRAEEMEAYSGGSGHYARKEMNHAAKDLKTWAHSVIQICVVTILYGEHALNQQSRV